MFLKVKRMRHKYRKELVEKEVGWVIFLKIKTLPALPTLEGLSKRSHYFSPYQRQIPLLQHGDEIAALIHFLVFHPPNIHAHFAIAPLMRAIPTVGEGGGFKELLPQRSKTKRW